MKLGSQTPAIVTPLYEPLGLDIARSLSQQGITVYGFESDKWAPGRFSNSCHFVQYPDIEADGESAYINFLINFGKSLGKKSVIYPIEDNQVLFISKNREILKEYYHIVMPDHDTILKLTTKDGLKSISEQYDIPAPRTEFVLSYDECKVISEQLSFPVLLKPTETTYWHTKEIASILRKGVLESRAKVIVCQNREELLNQYKNIAPHDSHLVIQEVIPGEDSRLFYISFYLNRESRPLGIFSGCKHRVIPVGFGSASYVKSYSDPKLVEAAMKILENVKYQGLGGIEFKLDPRDNQYKLIEFNTRFGLWDGLGKICGVDLPFICYCDTIGTPIEPQFSFRQGVIWVDWQRDVRAAYYYRKISQLSTRDWLRSLRGEKMTAVFSKADWKPGFVYAIGMIIKLLKRIFQFIKKQ